MHIYIYVTLMILHISTAPCDSKTWLEPPQKNTGLAFMLRSRFPAEGLQQMGKNMKKS